MTFLLKSSNLEALSIGFGISCFMRTIVSYFVAMKNNEMILYSLKVIFLYTIILGLILSALLFTLSSYVGRIFYSDSESLETFGYCYKIFCLHFTFTYFIPVINSTYRFPQIQIIIYINLIFILSNTKTIDIPLIIQISNLIE